MAAQRCPRSGWWDGPWRQRKAWRRRRRWRRRCSSCARASPAAAGRDRRTPRSPPRAAGPGPSHEDSSCCRLRLRLRRRLAERGRRNHRTLICGGVDVTAAVDRGFERQQQGPEACGIACALEYLPDRERASCPRMLTGKRGGDPGAKRAYGTDAISDAGQTIGVSEEVGWRARTHGCSCHRIRREMSPSGAEDDHRRGGQHGRADDVEVDRRYLRSAAAGAAEQESQEVVDPVLDPLAEPVEQARWRVERVVTLLGEDLV